MLLLKLLVLRFGWLVGRFSGSNASALTAVGRTECCHFRCDCVHLCRVFPVCLQFFRSEGCRMVEMSCEEHDRQAASTQFITHTVSKQWASESVEGQAGE